MLIATYRGDVLPDMSEGIHNTWIIVNIHNDPELYNLVIATIPYMRGWSYDGYSMAKTLPNPKWDSYPNGIPKFLRFDMCVRVVRVPSFEHDETARLVADTTELSALLESINEWCLELNPDQGKDAFDRFFSTAPSTYSIDFSQQAVPIVHEYPVDPSLTFPMDFVYSDKSSSMSSAHIQKSKQEQKDKEDFEEMSELSHKYAEKPFNPAFYGKITIPEKSESLSAEPVDSQGQMDKILSCQSLDELSKMLIKLEGKHDDWSETLKKAIHSRADKLGGVIAAVKKATGLIDASTYQCNMSTGVKHEWPKSKKVHWPTPEEVEKIHTEMVSDLQAEIDVNIIDTLAKISASEGQQVKNEHIQAYFKKLMAQIKAPPIKPNGYAPYYLKWKP